MKKIVKKNQIIIGALAALLAVAGYINYGGNELNLGNMSVRIIKGSYGAWRDQEGF